MVLLSNFLCFKLERHTVYLYFYEPASIIIDGCACIFPFFATTASFVLTYFMVGFVTFLFVDFFVDFSREPVFYSEYEHIRPFGMYSSVLSWASND